MTFRRFFNPVSLLLYVFLYVFYDIIIVISSRNNTSFSFHPIVVIFSAELLKFLISATLFAREWIVHKNTGTLVVPSNATQGSLAFKIVPTDPRSKVKAAFVATPETATKQIQFESLGLTLSGFQSLLPGDVVTSVQVGTNTPVSTVEAGTDPQQVLSSLAQRSEHSHHQLTFRFARSHGRSTWLKTLGLFGVAALYTIWNVLNYEALLRVRLSQYSIIYQINIVFVVLLWTVLFQRKFSVLQWFSIALLIGGCVLIRMGKGYVVVLSWALVYVVAQAFVSAVAGVVNEYLYKDGELRKLSLNLQNVFLYGYSVVCCLIYALILRHMDPSEYSFASLGAESIQSKPLVLSMMSTAIGLNTAYILKNLSNIAKIFATALHSPIEIVAAHFIIGTNISVLIIIASTLITSAVILFKAQDSVFRVFCPKAKRNWCGYRVQTCPSCRKSTSAEDRDETVNLIENESVSIPFGTRAKEV